MPESEPKPKLIELVAPGAGQGWKAVLKSGKAVVVHEIPVPAAEAVAAIPRIQRLFENRHPSLSPVLAWGTDPNGLWVAVEPNEGVPLGTILSRGPLTPPAAAALGAALLSGVSALHEAGISMGGFGASAVRVNGNGEVRLSGHPAAAARGAPSQSDLRADVRSSGMAICAAFGVDPAGAPATANIPPGLVVTMRSMASGAMGPAADRAQGALREMASALLSPDRLLSSQAELALRSGGREMPPVTPFLPKTEAPAPAAPAPAPREETPLPAAVSYDAPPRPSTPQPSSPWGQAPPAPPPAPPQAPSQPSTPPTPSPYAAPPPPAEAPPYVPLQSTNPPAPAPPAAPPAPAPEPPKYEPPKYEPPKYEPPPYVPPPVRPAPAPFEPLPSIPERGVEPPHAPYFEPVTPAPKPRTSTWTPASSTDLPSYLAEPAVADAAADTATGTSPGRKSTVARRPADKGPSQQPSWLRPAIIAVAILVLLAIGVGIFAATRGKSTTTGGTPTPSSPSPRQSPKASPIPTIKGPQPVPAYAPGTAGPITSVAYLPAPDTACDLGGGCKVTVEIKFSTPQSGSIAYTLKFFDRCSGVTTDLPGNNFTPPGFTTVDITTAGIQLPSGAKSAGLVAVTTSPATAASPPLPLGADTCT